MSFEENYYYERLQSLVDGLVTRTRDAIAHNARLWEQPEREVYELSLTKSSIRLYAQGRNGQKPYILELYGAFGDLVDRVEDDIWGSGPIQLEELYNLVSQGEKQKAKEETLTDVLNELNIPEPPF